MWKVGRKKIEARSEKQEGLPVYFTCELGIASILPVKKLQVRRPAMAEIDVGGDRRKPVVIS